MDSTEKFHFIGITHKCLDLSKAVDFVKSNSAGAIATFSGTTRSTFENKIVTKLEYEAYEPMALNKMKDIANSMKIKFGIEKVWIEHRLGEVPVGETSVLICASSTHRKETLAAIEYGIDTLKETVPIWKKEMYKDGGAEWKENAIKTHM